MALALARKYRPRSFSDLVGQETVSQTLTQALDGNRLSHAYLFSGIRGSGKTSTARIFAKALLCEKGPSSQPCEVCPHCVMANEYRHMDIIEMDAASNRGIDDIKELIEHTKYKPGSGRFKIFIIDEVHMLTTQAFNALLKTLEEPPEFVKFIMATTDPLKLPATILSRTQHFRFKKIPSRLIKSHLEHILHLEDIEYEPEALEIIARSGAGSLRDSLTLLDQAIVYAKGRVDLATVTEMLGIIDPATLNDLLDRILRKDQEGILDFVKESSEFESEMIIDELTLHLKELLFAKDPRFSPLILDRFFRILAEAKELLYLGSDGEFVLSLSLFKMVEALSIKEIDEMIQNLQQELSKTHTLSPKAAESALGLPTRSAPNSKESTPIAPSVNIGDTIQSSRAKEAPNGVDKKSSTPTKNDKDHTSQSKLDSGAIKFKALLERLYDRDYELGESFERCISYKSFDGVKLSWVSNAQGEDKKRLIDYWGFIRMFVQEIFGMNVKIINIAKEPSSKDAPNNSNNTTKSPKPPSPSKQIKASKENTDSNLSQEECSLPDNAKSSSSIEALELPSSCIDPNTGGSESSKEKDPSTLLKEPMVKEAIELFDPKCVRIMHKS